MQSYHQMIHKIQNQVYACSNFSNFITHICQSLPSLHTVNNLISKNFRNASMNYIIIDRLFSPKSCSILHFAIEKAGPKGCITISCRILVKNTDEGLWEACKYSIFFLLFGETAKEYSIILCNVMTKLYLDFCQEDLLD